MKKVLIGLFISLSFIGSVSAQEIFYQNDNGVYLTQEEYDYFTKVYFDGYQKFITIDEYNEFIEQDLLHGEIESKEYIEYKNNSMFKPLIDNYSTASKTIKITKNCSNDCLIYITNTWKTNPKVRSYDLIGAYSDKNSISKFDSACIIVNNQKINYTEKKVQSDGISATLKLPSSNGEIKATLTFIANKSGKIYGSYQHATKSISLSDSRKYTFSNLGYGGVFLFNTNIRSYYDNMNGVDIIL